jgi:hypothetical protein
LIGERMKFNEARQHILDCCSTVENLKGTNVVHNTVNDYLKLNFFYRDNYIAEVRLFGYNGEGRMDVFVDEKKVRKIPTRAFGFIDKMLQLKLKVGSEY